MIFIKFYAIRTLIQSQFEQNVEFNSVYQFSRGGGLVRTNPSNPQPPDYGCDLTYQKILPDVKEKVISCKTRKYNVYPCFRNQTFMIRVFKRFTKRKKKDLQRVHNSSCLKSCLISVVHIRYLAIFLKCCMKQSHKNKKENLFLWYFNKYRI